MGADGLLICVAAMWCLVKRDRGEEDAPCLSSFGWVGDKGTKGTSNEYFLHT